jgi:hypothetical protein
MSSKTLEELKIATLVYFRYFSEFTLSRLGFFLGFSRLNQLKRLADSLGPPVSQPEWA